MMVLRERGARRRYSATVAASAAVRSYYELRLAFYPQVERLLGEGSPP